MEKIRKLERQEITGIFVKYPFLFIDNPPLVVKNYKNGKQKLFIIIDNKKYIIEHIKKENVNDRKDEHDEWFEVI